MNKWSFDGQKALHFAKKRDYARSKLSVSKRLRAYEDADKLVEESMKIDAKTQKELERTQRPEGRDEAMNTVIGEMKKDMSIKRLTL